MDQTTLQTVLWIAAAIILVLFVMRRRKRKSVH
jgi:LPXTG-motif cell wall-anchored protein